MIAVAYLEFVFRSFCVKSPTSQIIPSAFLRISIDLIASSCVMVPLKIFLAPLESTV